MACAHPAAFSLLLSLPILRLSICLGAETHGTSCPTRHTSQKFTSCSSARLLHTKTIPRTCINRPSFTLTASRHTKRQANASPFYRYPTLLLCLYYILMHLQQISNSAHPNEMFRPILLFPPAQIWNDSGNTLCYFNGVSKGKRRRTIFI